MDSEIKKEITLESKIEALLFFKSEPMSLKKIASVLDESEEDTLHAISNLKKQKEGSGVIIVESNDEYILGTNAEMSKILEEVRKEELSSELSKAMLETLSIILYKSSDRADGKSGVTRSEIDYIRGVNSSFILRNLSIRGLVSKTTDKNDNRRYVYKPTLETLQFMGISKIEDLPKYNDTVKKLNEILSKNTEQNTNDE